MSFATYATKESGELAPAKPASKSPVGSLRIGDPRDAHEREADRVADEIMAGAAPKHHWSLSSMGMTAPLPRKRSRGGSGNARGEGEECKKKDEDQQTAQRKASGAAAPEFAPPIVHEVLNSPGQPLDRATRDFFGPRFGYDFSEVRVHSDMAAAESARAVGALGYSVGEHVVFARGRAPTLGRGCYLLAHELAHVVQQTQRGVPLTVARVSDDPRHQRGHSGEQDTGSQIYRAEDGWILIEGPSGSSKTGHGTTSPGFDAVAYNTRTDQLDIVDNKSNKTPGNVSSATAIDPAKNLAKNLRDLADRLTARQDVEARIRVLDLLRQTIAAVEAGTAIPGKVHLVVTGLGGQKSGVSGPLQQRGVEFKAPIPDVVRMGLAKLRDARDRLRNKIDLYSGEHKVQLDLIEKPSVTGFIGYVSSKVSGGETPRTAIWGNAFGGLAALDGALRRQDLVAAIAAIGRTHRAYVQALKQYVTWKNGVQAAAEAIKTTAEYTAYAAGAVLAVAGAIVAAPVVLEALGIAGAEATGGAAITTEVATATEETAIEAGRVLTRIGQLIEESEATESGELEELIQELQSMRR